MWTPGSRVTIRSSGVLSSTSSWEHKRLLPPPSGTTARRALLVDFRGYIPGSSAFCGQGMNQVFCIHHTSGPWWVLNKAFLDEFTKECR